jgi:ABC transporter substrate binding protein
MGDLAQTLIAHQPGRPLTKTPGGAQTALLLLLFESGALARGLPAIPLAHGNLLSLSLVHPRLPHGRASVHAIWALEGQNVVIEWRFAGGRAERLPDLAAELVRLGVDLIVVPSTPTALAAKNATKTIPIVTVGVGDPVGLGLASRRASSLVQPNRSPSTLVEILRRMVPRTRGWVRLANLCAELSPLAAPQRRAAPRARPRGQSRKRDGSLYDMIRPQHQ